MKSSLKVHHESRCDVQANRSGVWIGAPLCRSRQADSWADLRNEQSKRLSLQLSCWTKFVPFKLGIQMHFSCIHGCHTGDGYTWTLYIYFNSYIALLSKSIRIVLCDYLHTHVVAYVCWPCGVVWALDVYLHMMLLTHRGIKLMILLRVPFHHHLHSMLLCNIVLCVTVSCYWSSYDVWSFLEY